MAKTSLRSTMAASNFGYIGFVILSTGLISLLFGMRPIRAEDGDLPPQRIASIAGQGFSVIGSSMIALNWWAISRERKSAAETVNRDRNDQAESNRGADDNVG